MTAVEGTEEGKSY